ncbi:MAG: hypothetical protein ABIU54_12940 [Candidatus Eisenbacteria bacterium]
MRRLLPLVLLALLAITLLPGLAAVDALDWREARDAEVARATSGSLEWVAPLYANEPWFEKPLFGYTHELVATRLLRWLAPGAPNELTEAAVSRAVRAAIAAALALLTASIGARCFGMRGGWLGGCALASMLGLPLATRSDGAQLLATLLAWLGIGALLDVVRGRAAFPNLTRLFAYLAFGLAFVTAGPMPALWPLLGFAFYFALARRQVGWREVRPLGGIAIIAGVALPWYGVMTALFGGQFLARVPWFPYAAETRGAWFTGPLLALSFTAVLSFPWASLLGASLRDAAMRLRFTRPVGAPDATDADHTSHLVLALMFAAVVPVALYPGPPLTAALPALPAMALLCGRFLDRVLEGDAHPSHLTAATRLAALMGTAAALLGLTLASQLREAAPSLRLLSAALFLACWAPLLADLRGARRLAAALFMLPMLVTSPILFTRVMPQLEPWLNTREVVMALNHTAPPNATVLMPEEPPPSFRLLAHRNLVVTSALGPAAATLAARDGRVYVVFRPAREREVVKALREPVEILLRSPSLVLARVLLPTTAR